MSSLSEGKQLILDMRSKKDGELWSSSDLENYFNETQGRPYVKFSRSYNDVLIDGSCTIAELEAILIALYNERGTPKG